MNTRWPALLSFVVKMKLLSSERNSFYAIVLVTEHNHRHYQDAYAALIIMFGSIVMLPPRTKRWAEAKVLADCISIKVRGLITSTET